MPDFLVSWPRTLALEGDVARIEQLYAICAELAKMRADIRRLPWDSAVMCSRAHTIKQELAQWAAGAAAQSQWSYSVKTLELLSEDQVLSGPAHVYQSYHGLAGWNMYRILHVILNQVILSLLKQPAMLGTGLQCLAIERRRMIEDDLCATVPQAIGMTDPLCHPRTTFMRGYALVWPLFFAGLSVSSAELDPHARRARLSCIIEKLRYLSKALGVAWADRVAASLEGKSNAPREIQRLACDLSDTPCDTDPCALEDTAQQTQTVCDFETSLIVCRDSIGQNLEMVACL